MRLRNGWMFGLGLALAIVAAACGGGTEPAPTAAAPAAASTSGGQKVDPATAGEIKGLVALNGVAPKNETIRMAADPVC